jgi:hypothetical protein
MDDTQQDLKSHIGIFEQDKVQFLHQEKSVVDHRE